MGKVCVSTLNEEKTVLDDWVLKYILFNAFVIYSFSFKGKINYRIQYFKTSG